jgi:hypothetical protein
MAITGRPLRIFIARSMLALILTYLAVPAASAQTAAAIAEEEKEEDLALKLQNPVADLISVPFQFNYDGRIGPGGKENKLWTSNPAFTN